MADRLFGIGSIVVYHRTGDTNTKPIPAIINDYSPATGEVAIALLQPSHSALPQQRDSVPYAGSDAVKDNPKIARAFGVWDHPENWWKKVDDADKKRRKIVQQEMEDRRLREEERELEHKVLAYANSGDDVKTITQRTKATKDKVIAILSKHKIYETV